MVVDLDKLSHLPINYYAADKTLVTAVEVAEITFNSGVRLPIPTAIRDDAQLIRNPNQFYVKGINMGADGKAFLSLGKECYIREGRGSKDYITGGLIVLVDLIESYTPIYNLNFNDNSRKTEYKE